MKYLEGLLKCIQIHQKKKKIKEEYPKHMAGAGSSSLG